MIAAQERLTARTGVPRDAVPPLARRAGSGKCLDLRGAEGRRPAFFPEENPQTSLPSPPPLQKRVKTKLPPTPSRGERRSGLSGVYSVRGSVTRPRTPVRDPSRAPRSLKLP